MAGILIVDDAKFMRMTLANILKKANHEVVGEAENGREAVELYRVKARRGDTRYYNASDEWS